MGEIERVIRELARVTDVRYTCTDSDMSMLEAARVLGDTVELDEVELLLVALERAALLTPRAATELHIAYLKEYFDE